MIEWLQKKVSFPIWWLIWIILTLIWSITFSTFISNLQNTAFSTPHHIDSHPLIKMDYASALKNPSVKPRTPPTTSTQPSPPKTRVAPVAEAPKPQSPTIKPPSSTGIVPLVSFELKIPVAAKNKENDDAADLVESVEENEEELNGEVETKTSKGTQFKTFPVDGLEKVFFFLFTFRKIISNLSITLEKRQNQWSCSLPLGALRSIRFWIGGWISLLLWRWSQEEACLWIWFTDHPSSIKVSHASEFSFICNIFTSALVGSTP